MSARGTFVVVIERGEEHVPIFMTDEDENALRFRTRQAARAAAVGAMWEHAWVWWIVDLREIGSVMFGTDVRP